jgi:exodeoxyribonuclease-3
MRNQTALGILTLNVCTPSQARAERQLEWLGERPEQVFVLTETSEGTGSVLLAERLGSAGWDVRFPRAAGNERGVLVASRVRMAATAPSIVDYLPARVQAISIGSLEIIGVYAPSRDESAEKVARKRRFLSELWTVIGSRGAGGTILIGDFNIVEPGQRSAGGLFHEWEFELYEELLDLGWVDAYRAKHPDRVEHSWVDFDGRGFRFDHAFVSGGLGDRLLHCEYVHETRETDLSDHSGLSVELDGVPYEELEVEVSLSGGPPALF